MFCVPRLGTFGFVGGSCPTPRLVPVPTSAAAGCCTPQGQAGGLGGDKEALGGEASRAPSAASLLQAHPANWDTHRTGASGSRGALTPSLLVLGGGSGFAGCVGAKTGVCGLGCEILTAVFAPPLARG